jgi:hypothetical protein
LQYEYIRVAADKKYCYYTLFKPAERLLQRFLKGFLFDNMKKNKSKKIVIIKKKKNKYEMNKEAMKTIKIIRDLFIFNLQ